MGSEVDHHQLTQERDQLRQQLAEANAARERAETDAAVLRVIVEKVEMLYFPYTGPGPTVAALIDEARTALSSGAGEKAAAVLDAIKPFAAWAEFVVSYWALDHDEPLPDNECVEQFCCRGEAAYIWGRDVKALLAYVAAMEKGEADHG